jgi:hypothetical protein
MKVMLTENKLEKIMLRYIQDIMKVDLEPTVDGNNLYYRDNNGDIFIKVDMTSPQSIDVLLSYYFYIKMFTYFKADPTEYHRLLKSVIEKITKLKVNEIIPSLMGYED